MNENPYYQKRKKELNHQLYDKVQSELAVFHKEMLAKTPEEIYTSAWEIVAKHEIADVFTNSEYSLTSMNALLKAPHLLQDIYEEQQESGKGIPESVEDYRKYMVKTEKILSGNER